MDAVIIFEFPLAVQHLDAVRLLSVFNQPIHPDFRRHIIRTIRHGVLMKHSQVLIIAWYDHGSFLLTYIIFYYNKFPTQACVCKYYKGFMGFFT